MIFFILNKDITKQRKLIYLSASLVISALILASMINDLGSPYSAMAVISGALLFTGGALPICPLVYNFLCTNTQNRNSINIALSAILSTIAIVVFSQIICVLIGIDEFGLFLLKSSSISAFIVMPTLALMLLLTSRNK